MSAMQNIIFSIQDNHMSEDIICRYGEIGRVITFEPTEGEFDLVNICDRIVFRCFKPDGNFWIKELEDIDGKLGLYQDDEQMTAAAGKGKFDLAFYTGDNRIYSCDGTIIIDTPVMEEDVIQSVSVIFGLRFPEDFQLKLTAGENIFISDDNVISATGGGGGGSYVGGNYISIINDVIDVKQALIDTINGKQNTLTAGTYITIASNVIDVTNTLINTINSKAPAFTTGTYIDLAGGVLDVNSTLLNAIAAKEDAFTTGTYVEIAGGVLDVSASLLNAIAAKQDVLTPGTYIDITNGVIDLTTGILTTINGKQNALTAGSYISITGSTIDVTTALINTINSKQDGLTAGTGLEIVSNVIGLTQTIQDTINSKISISALADDYDELSTYAVNDFVVINNALYKCNTTINPAHTYDPTEWTAVPELCDDITALENNMAQLLTDVSDLKTLMGTADISAIGDGSVTGAITTLNSTLAVTSGISMEAITVKSGVSIDVMGSQILYKYGYFCFVHLCFQTTGAISAGTVIFELPTGSYQGLGNYATYATDGTVKTIDITTDGKIKNGIALASGVKLEFNAPCFRT